MAIEVLPPQLANQIAAGEVVERPASVIKELVENSIDASASRIDIEIDKGGSKLIRIRDNGNGIAKEQLGLALSRHATSKLHTLDDLDAIMSFGFRGEALASISSVSRLTITSRPAEQPEAWQAYAEGSQMAVKVNPAAHPVGTTIEAVDLFFNTPARRRFLKSDKTEFTHIDEWLKRIAIVQPSIHFTLQHNGKMVRNYRPAVTQIQFVQRLSQISSRSFAEQALHVECQHEGLKLTGYMQAPDSVDVGTHLDVHYFYVNGRLVRDRLVNHAVRQAFSFGCERSNETKLPSYVLMLELDPHQVDVNVHPAKHEVRFHQARYIHDYILQALQTAITAANDLSLTDTIQAQEVLPCQGEDFEKTDAAISSVPQSSLYQNDRFELSSSSPSAEDYFDSEAQSGALNEQQSVRESVPTESIGTAGYFTGGARHQYERKLPPSSSAVNSYCELVKAQPLASHPDSTSNVNTNEAASMPPLLEGRWWVLADDDKLRILALEVVALKVKEHEIANKWSNGLIPQPLLMPVSIPLDADWPAIIEQYEVLLRQLGLELTIRSQQLIIKKVPPYLRNVQIATVIPELLQWLRFDEPEDGVLINWLAKHSVKGFTQAEEIWRGLNCLSESQQGEIKAKAINLPWQNWLKEQSSDKN